MKKTKLMAMLLAGGQGSRLGILTKRVAKPAVPFGGKYRIIDFPLSNCTHSGIDVVGVLTQYQPLELNTYIGSGAPWDLDLSDGGAFVLPPYVRGQKGEWYRGTANAIYQNIGFIEQYSPGYVLILSGDHIYKMDYAKMLSEHIKKGADATIAVIDVPWDEADRFGIMNTDSFNRITEFEEKPKNPRSNKASMGIYIFTWDVLRQYLAADESDPNSQNDFGKNIIPSMLADNKRMFAYGFEGYWRDVGTIQSLWDANMDLLRENSEFDIGDVSWRIYARNPALPPHHIAAGSSVTQSMITEGCDVYGRVEHSMLFAGVTVQSHAVVRDSVIMPGAKIGHGAIIQRAIIAENAVIEDGAAIGGADGEIAVVGADVRVPRGMTIEPGAQADQDFIEKRTAAIEGGAIA